MAVSRSVTMTREPRARASAPLRQLTRWVERHAVLTAVAIGLCCAIAAWFRLPPLARNTLWAEDGRTFLQGALSQGPVSSLFDVYAGYLHTIPRIIAALVVQLAPVPMYAYAMTAASCLAAGGAASVVYLCARDVVPWLPARIAIAAVTVLAPLEPREVLGNAANLHSILFWMLFWMLLYRPRGRRESVVLGVIALLAALTEIQVLYLLPLLLWRWRDRMRWPLRAGLLLGAATQLAVTLMWPRGASAGPLVGLPSIVFGYLINSVVPLWLPQRSIGPAMATGGFGLAVLLAVPVLAAAIFAYVRGTRLQRVTVVALMVGSFVVYAGSILDNSRPFYDYASLSRTQLESLWLVRYGVVPSMMLIAVFLVALSTRKRGRRVPFVLGVRRERGIVLLSTALRAAVLGVVVLLLLVQFVPQWTRRSSGPAWSPQVAARAEACESAPDSTQDVFTETIGWKVTIDCGVLEKVG